MITLPYFIQKKGFAYISTLKITRLHQKPVKRTLMMYSVVIKEHIACSSWVPRVALEAALG